MSKNTGGPAFPHSFVAHPTEETFVAKGMTLRDYFAAKAMQAIMADDSFLLRNDTDQVADRAYEMADAMMKAREQ